MTAILDQAFLAHLLEIAGLGMAAFLAAAVTAAVYRWYLRERVSTGLSLLVALAVVALYLNVKSALGEVVAGETSALSLGAVVFNGTAFVVAAVAVPIGIRVGDRLYRSSVAVSGARSVEGEVSRFVRTVGRLVAIELPTDIEDIPAYDPVDEEVKTALAGTTLLFPKGLTVPELRDRVELRLTDDYDVGAVDIDLESDGTVSFLAVGRQPAGLGPTLAPGTAAVAVTADPPNAASPGDMVQLWSTTRPPTRVTRGEVRATAGDVVTLAVDSHDAPTVAGGEYRLVTLPMTPRPEREFGGLLRADNATMAAVTIGDDSALVGATVGSLQPSVIAVGPTDGPFELVPRRSRQLAAGETLYVIARPDAIRRIETAATLTEPAEGS